MIPKEPAEDVRKKVETICELYTRHPAAYPFARALFPRVWQLTLSNEYVMKLASKLEQLAESTDATEQLEVLTRKTREIYDLREQARFEGLVMHAHCFSEQELRERDTRYIVESTPLAQRMLDELLK